MPNDDLISRKALIEEIEEDAKHMMFTSHHDHMLHDDMVEFAVNAIECAPSVDAEPVRHAINVTEWYESDQFLCSNCGFGCEITELRYGENGMSEPKAYEYSCKYCPECGAKIDLKEDTKCTQQ